MKNLFNSIRDALKGKKTYILTSIAILAVVAKQYGYITGGQEIEALWVLGFGSLAALRAGVAKLIQGSNAELPPDPATVPASPNQQ